MHATIADKREELAELCRRYGVARLEVFGSAARGADFDPQTSDADFLVEIDPDSGLAPFDQFFDLAEALRHTLGRPVDLVESGPSTSCTCARPSTGRVSLSLPPDPRVLLTDIDRAEADTELFTEGMDRVSYAGDALTQAAVDRKFEIIGEALNRLRKSHPELAERIPQHRRIIDFRNLLVHGYASVMPKLVWDYAENHLPRQRQIVQDLLAELGPLEQ